jgi:predicted RNA binding protein YcfA (HicA-like mRNA interferase family)
MSRIASLPAKKVVKALEKIGFEQIRQRGSTYFYGIRTEEPR